MATKKVTIKHKGDTEKELHHHVEITENHWWDKLKPAAKAKWRGLVKRPKNDAEGWVGKTFFNPLFGVMNTRVFTDPETGEKWQDHPPLKSADIEFYWIAAGCPETTSLDHNGFWYSAEGINETFTPEGMARVRDYPGKYLLTDPAGWPEPWRSLFAEGHPKWDKRPIYAEWELVKQNRFQHRHEHERGTWEDEHEDSNVPWK